MRIIIIGKGHLATNLQAAFARKGVEVPMYSSREGLSELPTNADLYIYAVKDQALEQVIEQVHVPARAMHVHTSGSMPLTVFGPDKPHCGILYPFQTFSKQQVLEDWSNVPIFIEGRGIDDISALYTVALMLSSRVYEATQQEREKLHVAGVLVNNFPNLLYTLAKRLLSDTHIPFDALLPLIDQTAAKVHTLDPYEAQTGPAVRHDQNVIEHHMKLLTTQKERDIYRLLSDLIQDLHP